MVATYVKVAIRFEYMHKNKNTLYYYIYSNLSISYTIYNALCTNYIIKINNDIFTD